MPLEHAHPIPTIDKAELSPTGTDLTNLMTGVGTIMPQLNYYQNTIPAYEYVAQPLPPGITVTSIASYWYNPSVIHSLR